MPPFYRVVSAAMYEGILYLAVLAVVFVLYSDLAESQCTTRYCQDHDEENLLAVCLRNQVVVEQLQKDLNALNVKHEQLQHNYEVIGRLQDEVTELKGKWSSLEKSKHSRTLYLSDYSVPWTQCEQPNFFTRNCFNSVFDLVKCLRIK